MDETRSDTVRPISLLNHMILEDLSELSLINAIQVLIRAMSGIREYDV